MSTRFDHRDLLRLGLGGAALETLGLWDAQVPYLAAGLRPEQCAYMEYHRRAVFVA